MTSIDLWGLIINVVIGLIMLFVGAFFSDFGFFTKIFEPIKKRFVITPYYRSKKFFEESIKTTLANFLLVSSDLDFVAGRPWREFGEFLIASLISLKKRGKDVKIVITTRNPTEDEVKRRILKLITYKAKLCVNCGEALARRKKGFIRKREVFWCRRCEEIYQDYNEGSFEKESIGRNIYFHHVDEAIYAACWNGRYSGTKLGGRDVVRKYEDDNILRLINDYFEAVGNLEETKNMVSSVGKALANTA